ncbi:transcriptional regulator [Xanthobacter flavus]|uniref:transcriptional regulator n=1 Tax=Xanthobacter flavus TaxID=281 RepID=UPI003728C39E
MTARPPADFHARARAGWGTPPDFIMTLADACARETQAGVARRLGLSGSLLSQALAGKYPGDMAKLEEIVRGALMGEHVTCPVLGEIGRDQCVAEQKKPFTASSSVRTRLYRACRAGCPNSRVVKERS